MSEMILTVSQLNSYIKAICEDNPHFKNIAIRGEISNYVKYYKSGHIYMTLKDNFASIKAVMFKYSAQNLKFEPENGMNVIVFGKVTAYEKDGNCQIIVSDIQPDGVGAQKVKLAQLYDKLEKEGLFDPKNKKPIPNYPEKIGVVSSKMGAAIQDIFNTVTMRWPIATIKFQPVLVQGEQAAEEISAAITKLNALSCDVIIVARGGGSSEDLNAFNEEIVARATARATTPIISAVGHETDTTLIDMVADERASTPTYGAMVAVPDITEVKSQLGSTSKRLELAFTSVVSAKKAKLEEIKSRKGLSSVKFISEKNIEILKNLNTRLDKGFENSLKLKKQEFYSTLGKLESLSPLGVLLRGYAVVYKDDMVADSSKLKVGDSIDVLTEEKLITSTISKISKRKV